MTKAAWGKKKGLFGLHISSHSQLRDLSQGRCWKQVGTRGTGWCRGHAEVLLIGFHHMTFSTCFLVEPRTTSPGVTQPVMRCQLIKKTQYRYFYSLIFWKCFLNGIFLLSDDSSLCQVFINWANTECKILSLRISVKYTTCLIRHSFKNSLGRLPLFLFHIQIYWNMFQ